MNRPAFAAVLSAFFILQCAVAPQLQSAEPASPVKLTLYPAGEPTPALKYRLLPGRLDQIAGNAAVHYGKVTAEEMKFFGTQQWRDKVDRWQEMPLEELTRENVNLPTSSIFFLEQGGRCTYCDWQLPIGVVPFYTILLPEAQQSRSYARVLAVKARQEIAQGNFDDAVKTFQTNYALGRNVAEGETLINGLIGIAITGVMFPQMLELVQQPNSPNLYWGLTLLPSPLIDMGDALDVERMGVELSFPELRDLESAERTADQWRELFHRFAKQVVELTATAETQPWQPSPEELDKACQEILPTAKRALVDWGMPTEEVEAMPVYEVALRYTLQLYHELLDDGIKYYSLPYPEAIQGIEAAMERARPANQERREIIPLASQILPALEATRNAVVRTDRQIALLRVIEALRIHAAGHQGELPPQLSDITEVPIPNDPVTGKPFVYRREADKAFLEGPPLRNAPLSYEITMGRPE